MSKFQIGDRVVHSHYGGGTVVGAKVGIGVNEMYQVKFDKVSPTLMKIGKEKNYAWIYKEGLTPLNTNSSVEIKIGDRVYENTHGTGTVIGKGRDCYWVEFDKINPTLSKDAGFDVRHNEWIRTDKLTLIDKAPKFKVGEVVFNKKGEKGTVLKLVGTKHPYYVEFCCSDGDYYKAWMEEEELVTEKEVEKYENPIPPAEKPCPPSVYSVDGLLMVAVNGRHYLFNKEGHCLKEFREVQDGDRSIKETV